MRASRFKRPASFSVLACAAALAVAWAVGEPVAAQVVGAQTTGLTFGAPFRSSDSGRAMSGLAPSYGIVAAPGLEAGILTPNGIEETLRARGFTHISNLSLRGGAYVCEATGPRRERVRLVLDAASGEISGVQVIGFAEKRY